MLRADEEVEFSVNTEGRDIFVKVDQPKGASGFINQSVFVKNCGSTGDDLPKAAMSFHTNPMTLSDTECRYVLRNVNTRSSTPDKFSDQSTDIVYPNPALDKIYINHPDSNNRFERIEFFSLSGNMLFSKTIETNVITINRKQLSSGIYYYKIYDQNNIPKTAKIVLL